MSVLSVHDAVPTRNSGAAIVAFYHALVPVLMKRPYGGMKHRQQKTRVLLDVLTGFGSLVTLAVSFRTLGRWGLTIKITSAKLTAGPFHTRDTAFPRSHFWPPTLRWV